MNNEIKFYLVLEKICSNQKRLAEIKTEIISKKEETPGLFEKFFRGDDFEAKKKGENGLEIISMKTCCYSSLAGYKMLIGKDNGIAIVPYDE